jgi:hypothetical protein
MAFEFGTFILSALIVDKKGNIGIKEYQLRATVVADAVTQAAAQIALLAPMTKGTIVKYILGIVYSEAAPAAVTSDMPVSTVVSATTNLTTAGKKANWSVNMPVDAIMAGNDLITTNALVMAYQASFLSGGNVYISDKENALGASPLKGKLVTRARSFD